MALQAQTDVQEWIQATLGSDSNPTIHEDSDENVWQKPTSPYVKCNFDASYDIHSQQVCGGWIIRDSQGTSKHWGSAILRPAYTPLEAEAEALLASMQQAWSRGFTSVHFEGDCKVLVNIINGDIVDTTIEGLCIDIHYWASLFQNFHLTFVKRSCNSVAHILAKKGCLNNSFFTGSSQPPGWLSELLYYDNFY